MTETNSSMLVRLSYGDLKLLLDLVNNAYADNSEAAELMGQYDQLTYQLSTAVEDLEAEHVESS